MSDDFNIRDFRNAGQSEAEVEAEKSNRTFYSCVIAIPVIAAIAGLGYKPLMQLRVNNVQAAEVAQAEYEAERRAKDPRYALISNLNSGKSINLNGSSLSAETKARNSYARRALNAREFLHRVDAKAYGFSAIEMETLKFTRTQWALTTCGHADLQRYYTRSNKSKYEALRAKTDAARQARMNERKAIRDDLALPKIENKAQAMAFVASGGVARHQKASMNAMAGMASMGASMEKQSVKRRRQQFNQKGCMKVRQIVQGGAMNLKSNLNLR